MGAEDFETQAKAETMATAFRLAQEDARYEYGHAGYTGTIAEKDGYLDCGTVPEFLELEHVLDVVMYWADEVPDNDNTKNVVGFYGAAKIQAWRETYNDKWGSCLGFDMGNGLYRFFGIASS